MAEPGWVMDPVLAQVPCADAHGIGAHASVHKTSAYDIPLQTPCRTGTLSNHCTLKHLYLSTNTC